MITRSNPQPQTPPTAAAASTALASAARFRHQSAAPTQPGSAASTLTARNAPSVMNPPCAKFSTSISPNTKVSPQAIRNSIIPIASPATVSVIQVGRLIAGKASSTSAGKISAGRKRPLIDAPRG